MKTNIDKEFYLTRGEYAKRVGKSKGSVIQAMRRGKLGNEYIIQDSCYYFRDPSRERAYKETVHGAIYTPKKSITAAIMTTRIIQIMLFSSTMK